MKNKNSYFLILALLVAFFGCTPGVIKNSKELINENKIDEAIKLLNSTVTPDSNNYQALLTLGSCYVLNADYAKAEKSFIKSRDARDLGSVKYRKNVINEMIYLSKHMIENGKYKKFIDATYIIVDEIASLGFGRISANDLLEQGVSFSEYWQFEDSLKRFNTKAFYRVIDLFKQDKLSEAKESLGFLIKINDIYKFKDYDIKKILIDEILAKQECDDTLFTKAKILRETIGMENQILDALRENPNCEFNIVSGNYYVSGNYELTVVPEDATPDANQKVFKLKSFSPLTSYYVECFDKSWIYCANADNLNNFINGGQFSCGNTYFSLWHRWFPEYDNYFKELKGLDKFAISEKKDIIYGYISNMLDSYTLPRLKYHTTIFDLKGRCFVFEDEYDYINEIMNVNLYIGSPIKNDKTYREYPYIQDVGAPVALVKVPMKLDVAKKMFKSKVIQGEAKYQVFIEKDFRMFDWRTLKMQNYYLTKSPIIFIPYDNGFIEIEVTGLQENLWPPKSETQTWERWAGKRFNNRIVSGRIVENSK